MKFYITLFIALIWISPCRTVASDEIRISYGLGTAETLSPDPTVKVISLGWHKEVSETICIKIEAGNFSDTRLYDPFTWYSTMQFGTQIKPAEWFYIENYFGPGMISQTSARLGSNFQFFLDLGVGFREPITGGTLGFGYQHISNAGIVQPNIGQNLMKLSVGFPI